MKAEATLEAEALWRRIDTVGTDAARLFRHQAGWRLDGTAVFLQEKKPAHLDYRVEFNADWTTSRGEVRGFVGAAIVEQTIVRDAAGWTMNGVRVAALDHLMDLDFGFTPATNLAYLRRANLAIGDSIDRAVVWWEPPAPSLQNLPQHYRRRDERTYWYSSPTALYEAVLEFAPNGFARNYPGLWVLESD